jgi:hypothetical protein
VPAVVVACSLWNWLVVSAVAIVCKLIVVVDVLVVCPLLLALEEAK